MTKETKKGASYHEHRNWIKSVVNYNIVRKEGIQYKLEEHTHEICPKCGTDFQGGSIYSICTSKPAIILQCGCGTLTTLEWVKVKK